MLLFKLDLGGAWTGCCGYCGTGWYWGYTGYDGITLDDTIGAAYYGAYVTGTVCTGYTTLTGYGTTY